MLQVKQKARRRMSSGCRQRIRRLKRRLAAAGGDTREEEDRRTESHAELTKLQSQRRALKRRGLINKGAWTSKASTKHFFSRICTKYGDNIVPTLKPPQGAPQRGVHDKADVLADCWEHIFNGKADNPGGMDDFIDNCKKTWAPKDLTDIDKEITEEEVAEAIKKCKIGKACGPDSLGNEWYKDNSDLLAPILAKLFNIFISKGCTPKTFSEAYIFSISKGGGSSNGLNYQPIALLNTDYKILTRILAWRVRRHIKELVHKTQFGFVPGRRIHEAIDLLEAAKVASKENEELSDAQVLLLDFAKAYDSLDRAFLYKVLEAKGFPPKFRAFVKETHDRTAVQFMANGHLSREMGVTSGIRQGCPLAPLLFILAVDLLYDAIEREQNLRGVKLEIGSQEELLQVAGYADDTAIYIEKAEMQADAIWTVGLFSAVSGLKLNINKSVALRLGTGEGEEYRGPAKEELVDAIEETRYLGHITGLKDSTRSAWPKAFAALNTRLALAAGKTNTVQERASIAAAIIVPKLMYVARHAWPHEDIVKEADWRIRNFVWKSSFAKPDHAPSGWIQAAVVEKGSKDGGIGMPNIRMELMAMATSTVGTWAAATDTQRQIAGKLLQHKEGVSIGHITPRESDTEPQLRQDIWSTGKTVVEQGLTPGNGSQGGDDIQPEALRQFLRLRNGLKSRWDQKRLHLELGTVAMGNLAKAKRWRAKDRGDLIQQTVETLYYKEIVPRNAEGKEVKWKVYRRILEKHEVKQLKYILSIEWVSARHLVMQPRTREMPMSGQDAHLFRDLGLSLLAQFPELAFRPVEPDSKSISIDEE